MWKPCLPLLAKTVIAKMLMMPCSSCQYNYKLLELHFSRSCSTTLLWQTRSRLIQKLITTTELVQEHSHRFRCSKPQQIEIICSSCLRASMEAKNNLCRKVLYEPIAAVHVSRPKNSSEAHEYSFGSAA